MEPSRDRRRRGARPRADRARRRGRGGRSRRRDRVHRRAGRLRGRGHRARPPHRRLRGAVPPRQPVTPKRFRRDDR
ncbi:hypothetical protein C5C90_14995 [Rathayibacter sp. AY1D4]|nr:hypothetical protein C5C90_14995 [Rathayibacter sp. AY1D4]